MASRGAVAPASADLMTIAARLWSLFRRHYHASTVQHAVVLMAFVGPAFLANLLVYYFTARILSAEDFGTFYVAITIGNVLYSGSLLLSIFLTRYLVQVGATGLAEMVEAARQVQRTVGFWGIPLSAAAFVLLTALSGSLGVQSVLVALLIILDTYASYLADIGRAFLQSRQQTWQLGTYTLVWMVLRLALSVLGAALFGTVWSPLLGSALAAVLSFAGFQMILRRAAAPLRRAFAKPPAFANLIPVVLGYGLLTVISNLDVLLSYFLLKDSAIGIYSASSVFPKGLLMVTMPVSQLLFAALLGDHESEDAFRTTVRTTIWVVGVLTAGAALAVWLLTPWLCGGDFGLKLCAPMPLDILLISAVLLSILRMTVLLEFVKQRDWLILSLLFPTLAYLVVAFVSTPGVETMAVQFAIFSAVALVFFTAIQLGSGSWRHVPWRR